MEILFISDYVCPYCLVAKEALDRALEKMGVQAHITYQPYELTPEPKERVDTYHDQRRRAGYQVLAEPCRIPGWPSRAGTMPAARVKETHTTTWCTGPISSGSRTLGRFPFWRSWQSRWGWIRRTL